MAEKEGELFGAAQVKKQLDDLMAAVDTLTRNQAQLAQQAQQAQIAAQSPVQAGQQSPAVLVGAAGFDATTATTAASPATGVNGDLVAQIVSALDSKLSADKKDAEAEMTNRMYDDRLADFTASVPAFGAYLSSKDDFGKERLASLREITDYKERLSTTRALYDKFTSAVSSDGADASSYESPGMVLKRESLDKKYEDIYVDKDGAARPETAVCGDFFELLSEELLNA